MRLRRSVDRGAARRARCDGREAADAAAAAAAVAAAGGGAGRAVGLLAAEGRASLAPNTGNVVAAAGHRPHCVGRLVSLSDDGSLSSTSGDGGDDADSSAATVHGECAMSSSVVSQVTAQQAVALAGGLPQHLAHSRQDTAPPHPTSSHPRRCSGQSQARPSGEIGFVPAFSSTKTAATTASRNNPLGLHRQRLRQAL
eukprot:m.278487 g.278487  ORF g.278487 m.278487 type:complete len:198 (-) comp11101_c0_seq98:1836-2429(-)